MQLGEGEFMITVNSNGTITVLDQNPSSGSTTSATQNQLNADMIDKCGKVDTFIRDKYWYYLRGAQTLYSSQTPTTKRYFCLNIYANIVGTFLFIGNW
jgi:hypothetical protein